MKEQNIFEKVLFVGPDYKVPRGGIASVLNTYSSFICPFKFIRTAASDLNAFQKIWYVVSGYVLLIWKLLTDQQIEIVHIHSASGSSFWRKSYVIKISKILGRKVIFHCHGGGFREFRLESPSKVDNILKQVDCVVCLSDVWWEYFSKIGCENIVVLKNVIPEPKIDVVKKDGLVHFLFLGLICDNKGIFDVLKVLSEHKEDFFDKIILHIGGNGQVERLLNTIKKEGIDQLVQYEGWVDNEKKQSLLNLSDVYILPSYIEGVPISILEAESYHKPIIATNVGGILSIVKNRETGLLVTPGNLEEIHHAIKVMADENKLRQHYGEVGYLISQEYLPSIIDQELCSLYKRVLNYTK